MSHIEILIRGEEAEAFAKSLLEIEGIELDNSINVYKGKAQDLTILTAAVITITQGMVSHGKDIKSLYDHYHNQQKLEVKIRQEDSELCDFQEFLLSFPIEASSIDTINKNLPNTSLPSLQEIAKLSIPERHRLLSPFIQGMAEDFKNDPELTIFSVLDGEGLEN